MTPNQNSTKLQNFIREHRFLSIAIFTILIIIGTLLIIQLIPHSSSSDPDEEIIPEIAPYPVFENSYLLTYSTNQDIANKITYYVGTIIVSEEEISSAPSKNQNTPSNAYNVTLEEASFKNVSSNIYYAYKVDLTVSDGRKYTLHLFVDIPMQTYLAIALDRTDTDSVTDNSIVYADNETAEKNAIELLNTIKLNSPTITKKSFKDI